jgi:hypothetical protein
MRAHCVNFRRVVLIVSAIAIPGSTSLAQTTTAQDAQPPALESQNLTGADARRAGELDQAIEAALKADRWGEATARAEELVALRARGQGRSTSRRSVKSGVSGRCAGWR